LTETITVDRVNNMIKTCRQSIKSTKRAILCSSLLSASKVHAGSGSLFGIFFSSLPSGVSLDPPGWPHYFKS